MPPNPRSGTRSVPDAKHHEPQPRMGSRPVTASQRGPLRCDPRVHVKPAKDLPSSSDAADMQAVLPGRLVNQREIALHADAN